MGPVLCIGNVSDYRIAWTILFYYHLPRLLFFLLINQYIEQSHFKLPKRYKTKNATNRPLILSIHPHKILQNLPIVQQQSKIAPKTVKLRKNSAPRTADIRYHIRLA